MGILDFWIKLSSAGANPEVAKTRLQSFVIGYLREGNNRVHVEDAISLIATITAERCIDLAGDYDLRDHEMTPGSGVMSGKVNNILFGDQGDDELDSYPSDSVIGVLRDKLVPGTYSKESFPSVRKTVEGFAKGLGTVEWGRVPLSVPKEHQPFLIPLKVGYETRRKTDEYLGAPSGKKERLSISVAVLVEILKMARPVLDARIAMTLALETLNGMAKTAPMTEKAMRMVVSDK